MTNNYTLNCLSGISPKQYHYHILFYVLEVHMKNSNNIACHTISTIISIVRLESRKLSGPHPKSYVIV